jgi:hypothetical protein
MNFRIGEHVKITSKPKSCRYKCNLCLNKTGTISYVYEYGSYVIWNKIQTPSKIDGCYFRFDEMIKIEREN